MKITKTRLKEIIKEEVQKILTEARTKADQGTLDAMGDKPPSDPDDKEYMKGYNDIVKFRGEEELDEMSTAGGATASVEGAPAKEEQATEQ